MSAALNIVLAQLSPRLGGTEANIETMSNVVADRPGADLIIFPELYLSGYVLEGIEELAVRSDGPELQGIAEVARESSTALIFGAPEHVEGGVANSAFCVDERGTVAAVYRKVQLFGGDESDAFVAGDGLLVVELRGVKIGLMICFDVEFPEVARALARGGAHLFVTISANMDPFGNDHAVFVSARALENGLPHAYVNQVGRVGDLTFVGGSEIVSQDGEVVERACSSGEEMLSAKPLLPAKSKLRQDYLSELRSPMPGVKNVVSAEEATNIKQSSNAAVGNLNRQEKTSMTHYEPADSFETPRFSGVRTFMRLPNTRDLENADAAIVGAPFDTGASFRVGARFGPEGTRSVSHLLRPYNPSQDVSIFEHLSVIDYGDVPVVPGYIEESYEKVGEGLEEVHNAGVVPIVLGGDHSIALPELRAAAAVHGPLALVQFDSHADTWDEYFGKKYNHGTVFRRAVEEGLLDPARSIQVGMRGSLYEAGDLGASRELGFELLTTDEVREIGVRETAERISRRVGDAKVYVSFDVDFVDPAFAPGTGTPEIGGFTSREAQEFVRGLAGLDVVGCDVVEVYPQYDGPGQITALLAANVAFEFLGLVARGKHARERKTAAASKPG